MSERKSISLSVNDGDLLKGFSWDSDKKAIGNVVIFEGMEEHVSRYDDFAKFLNKNGYNACWELNSPTECKYHAEQICHTEITEITEKILAESAETAD